MTFENTCLLIDLKSKMLVPLQLEFPEPFRCQTWMSQPLEKFLHHCEVGKTLKNMSSWRITPEFQYEWISEGGAGNRSTALTKRSLEL